MYLLLLCIAIAAARAHAQDQVRLQADVLVYGDNTEFKNPFREGETLLGAATRVVFAVDVARRATVTLGVFANQRFGGDEAFEQVRPVVSIGVQGRRSVFVFGTLPPGRHNDATRGPDRQGPHGLLPPLQRETLAFTRPYEAGLEWRFAGDTLQHELWLNWQRLNTAAHRERFDAGLQGGWRVTRALTLPYHAHVVHQGGQLFMSGPVADSFAAALGVSVTRSIAEGRSATIDMFGAASRFVPDRSKPARNRSGGGMFARAAIEDRVWRGHLIFWRGKDFVTEEGDPNYLSVRRSGSRYRGTRDYAEAGLARTFRPARGVSLEASARLHRTERYYEYSYRILGVASVGWRIR